MMNRIFAEYKRTCSCGALRAEDEGKDVVLMGWVHNIRDLGKAGLFVLLRDREGITQVLFQREIQEETFKAAAELSSEYCIAVRGRVVSRGEKNINKGMETGEIEVHGRELEVLSESETPPFEIRSHAEAREELRLRYRYLDLRKPELLNNFIKRSEVSGAVREYLVGRGFLEVETPFLVKYTPGGCRNFLVPSRLRPGHFYALAESPQIFKQLLMISGFDRYFQIVRCFRDEDPRQDRQVEFTQIDIEMSFAREEDVYCEIENLFAHVWKNVQGVQLSLPLPRLTYDEAMEKYGTDKPDLRFGLEHHVITDLCRECGFRVFENSVSAGHLIKAIRVPGGAETLSRKMLDELTSFVKREEVGPVAGLAWGKATSDGKWSGAFAKAMKPEALDLVANSCGVETGDGLLVLAGPERNVHKAADGLRRRLARELNFVSDKDWAFCWITEFPLLEWSEERKAWASSHHPFTMPREEDMELLSTDPGAVRARAYDLVLNGSEVAGGSLRIHKPEVQKRVLEALGISDEEARDKFGFLLEAFRYGAPPHAGIAAGLDRIMMILCDTDSIRDVIPFPKTITGMDLMTGAPGTVSDEQMREVYIKSLAEPSQE